MADDQHVRVDEDTTIWIADGGLLGINEPALMVCSTEDGGSLSAIPLSKINDACARALKPSFVVRWQDREPSAGDGLPGATLDRDVED